MRAVTTIPLHTPRSRTAPRVGAVCLAMASLLAASPLQAQLGKLKKLGADAVKDAAKEKLGTAPKQDTAKPDAGAAPSARSADAPMPTLDDQRITAILASLTPLVRGAEIRTAAARARPAWEAKSKARDECINTASKNPDPMKMMAIAQKNEAKTTAMMKQMEAVQNRYTAATNAGDLRRQAFLLDSLAMFQNRAVALTFDLTCVVEPTPAAIIEQQVLDRQESGRDDFDPGATVRGLMSGYDYGLLRERMALYALQQENPSLKGLGKQGVFTADEQAALGKHAAELRKLAPLFASDAIIWKSWSDLKSW